MKLKTILLIILAVLLAAEVGLLISLNRGEEDISLQATEPEKVTDVLQTEPIVDLTQPSETQMPAETQMPTEPAVTEPKEKTYTLSFVGDCTFGSLGKNWSHEKHFIQVIGENYDYPFDEVRDYFENDDFTILNLEGPLTDSKTGYQSKTFSFRGPTAYTQIMTGSSVEAVTLANNHAMDYGQAGYDSTTKALSDAGITYVEKDKTAMYTTESGLVIGLYAAAFEIDIKDMTADIADLRSKGAEIVICAFHWGEEGVYRADANQQRNAKAAIDAGADVVYGHHPHVLQKIEQYKDKYIFYSLGNFSFGGIAAPRDTDTALLQLKVIRGEDGKVRLGELDIIPCTYWAEGGYNSYRPNALEVGSKAYNRILSKLDGTFDGPDLDVDYEKPNGGDSKPPATTPPASGGEGGDSGNGGGGDTPVDPPSGGGDTGGNTGGSGDSGGGSSGGGGDSGGGSSGGGDSGGGSSGGGGEAPSPAPPADPPSGGSGSVEEG